MNINPRERCAVADAIDAYVTISRKTADKMLIILNDRRFTFDNGSPGDNGHEAFVQELTQHGYKIVPIKEEDK